MDKRALVAILALFVVGTGGEDTGFVEPRAPDPQSPVEFHLASAMMHMDRGPRSREYRESIDFLRVHADEAIAESSGPLLDAPGSFFKWQLTYLIGEFGDQSAIRLLRDLIDQPFPEPEAGGDASHAIDLQHSENVAARVQAVMSTARIAKHRPSLRDPVITELLETAREVPMLKSSALFELAILLGPELDSLRSQFGPEDAKLFDPFLPPPEWQALLQRRMQAHREQGPAQRDEGEPLCRTD